jgi:thioredoxin-like negative regulator of GroEL
MSIPTLILFKKGQVLTQVVGFKPKDQFKKVLDEALGEAG